MWPGAERDNVNGFISVATSDLLSKTLFKTQGAPLFLLVKFDRESVKERRPFFFSERTTSSIGGEHRFGTDSGTGSCDLPLGLILSARLAVTLSILSLRKPKMPLNTWWCLRLLR